MTTPQLPRHRADRAVALTATRQQPTISAKLSVLACLTLLASVPFITPARAAAPAVDLRVDSNRDGVVEVLTPTATGDDALEDTQAAIVLPNLDDDTNRCHETRKEAGLKPLPKPKVKKNAKGTKGRIAGNVSSDEYVNPDLLPRDTMVQCFDAADEVVNGPADALDLAPARILPQPGVAADATAKIAVSSDKFRVFVAPTTSGIAAPEAWKPVTSVTVLTADQLRSGVSLAIEAKDVIRDAKVWDGTATLTVTTTSAGSTSSDSVKLQVAPALTTNHLQPVKQLWVNPSEDKPSKEFRKDLRKLTDKAGVEYREVNAGDQWMQDLFETMYVAMPTPTGSQSMHLLMLSDQDRPAGQRIFQQRGQDLGIIWLGKVKGDETLDSTGNVETIPPYVNGSKSYPQGRIIIGHRPGEEKGEPSQRMLSFFNSQGKQSPLLLDVSFLAVGHVDEIVQFLPAENASGFKIAIADPRLAIKLLRQAQAKGAGNQPILTRNTTSKNLARLDIPTVDEALGKGKGSLLADNAKAAAVIDKNLATLLAETGLTEADVIRVPVLFQTEADPSESLPKGYEWPKNLPKPPPVKKSDLKMTAFVPDAVNNIVVSPNQLIIAKQFGVKVGGKDLFADAVTKAYASVGFTSYYVDNFESYHVGSGEVHCGTNVLRDVSTTKWWQ